MNINFLEIADFELDEAIAFYNYQSAGLGDEFLTEVLEAIERIKLFPNAWHLCSKNTRRCRIKRFPYGIIYQLLDNEILIVAIAHIHREPDYWKKRIH